MTQIQSGIARSNGIDLAWEARGRGPPVLLITGLGAQLLHWPEGLVEALASRGLRVIRFDNRDVGLSTHLAHLGRPRLTRVLLETMRGRGAASGYTLWDLADDAAGLLDDLGISTAHVVGMSMGGMVAQCLAIAHPQRVRSLASMASSPREPWVSAGRLRMLRRIIGLPPTERDAAIDWSVSMFQALNGPAWPVEEHLLRALVTQAWERDHDRDGPTRQFVAIVTSGDRTERLGALRVPSLVLHGTADPLVPFAAGLATAAAIPGARFTPVEGWGHDLPPPLWPWLVEILSEHILSAELHAPRGVPGRGRALGRRGSPGRRREDRAARTPAPPEGG